MAAFEETGTDMKGLTRDAILAALREAGKGSRDGWMVAVLDKGATRVISSVVTMFDIMEERITLVESLEKKRQPFPQMEAIYFLAPTAASVKLLIEDFKDKKRYAAAHVFFLSKMGNDVLGLLKTCPALISRIQTLKEINVDFLSAESHVFHLDMDSKEVFKELYASALDLAVPSSVSASLPQRIATKLVTVCASLHECPIVRCRPDSPMEAVGRHLVGMLTDLKTNGSGWWHHGMPGHTDRPQSAMLLLDRSEDTVSPALHFCTYQALVNDLLEPRDGNVITLEQKGKKTEVLLNEKDELWVKFKHMHIADVLGGLKEYLDLIKARNPAAHKMANGGGGDAPSLAEMGALVKSMPEYQKQLDLYSQHTLMAQKCMREIQARDGSLLNMINDIEQTLATGFDQEGKPLKVSAVVDEMMDYLMTGDANLKLRLVLILVATQTQRKQLPPQDLDRVCVAAGLAPEDKKVVQTLQKLLGSTQKQPAASAAAAADATAPKKSGWGLSSSIFGGGSAKAEAAAPEPFDYPSSRFTCPLKSLAVDLAADKLSQADFPPIPGQNAISSARPAAQSARRNPGWSSKKPAFTGARSFMFIAGGVTFAEMHFVSAVSEASNKEIVLGGTSILTPAAYLDGLRAL